MNDFNETGAKRLWQSQPSETPSMSAAHLRYRANELERAFRLRNFIEQGAGFVSLIACPIMLLMEMDVWFKASIVLLMVGNAWALFQWRRRARQRSNFAAADTGLAFYRRELEHKRNLHRTVWSWYVLPMMPGTLALITWNLLSAPAARGYVNRWVVPGVILAWLIGALFYERAKVAQYQRELDALDASDAEPSARWKD